MKRGNIALLLIAAGLLLVAGLVKPVRETVVETVASWFDALKRLIARHEGLSLKVYQDPVGLWTIGYGHLVKPTDPYHPYGPITEITQDEADRLLAQDVAIAERCVSDNVQVPLTANQRAALVSFVFNVGCTNFRNSTLLRLLNEGRMQEAAAELDKFVFARGVRLAGLVKRRASERELFETA